MAVKTTKATAGTGFIVKGSALTNAEIDGTFISINDDVLLKAPIASPTFTSVPAAPTATAGTNTSQLATTAFVFAERTNVATLTNKTLTAPVVNSPTGIVKADVGLGNVDNTSNVTERAATATLTNKTLTNPAHTEVTLTDGATVNWDMNSGHVARWTITATGRTLAVPTNYKVGGQYILFVGLNTPSTMTPTWPAIIQWNYGVAPDLTTSSWTIISLVWSSVHSKFLGTYSPGF